MFWCLVTANYGPGNDSELLHGLERLAFVVDRRFYNVTASTAFVSGSVLSMKQGNLTLNLL